MIIYREKNQRRRITLNVQIILNTHIYSIL